DPEIDTPFLPEAIRRIVRQVGPEVPVLGFAAAPWTLACYMVEGRTREGFVTVKSFLLSEPATFRDLLHRIAQATVPYLKAQINYPLFESPNRRRRCRRPTLRHLVRRTFPPRLRRIRSPGHARNHFRL